MATKAGSVHVKGNSAEELVMKKFCAKCPPVPIGLSGTNGHNVRYLVVKAQRSVNEFASAATAKETVKKN